MRNHIVLLAVLFAAACQVPYTEQRAEEPPSEFIVDLFRNR